jgi:hypothetical protein
MRQKTFLQVISFLVLLALSAGPVLAAQSDTLAGDWLMQSDWEGRPINSFLLISKDPSGSYTGKWASFFGISSVENFKVEGDNIRFTQTSRFRDQEMTSTFIGTLKGGTIEGLLSTDNADIDYKGKRVDAPPVVGVWEFRMQRQDREMVSTLNVSQNEQGQITADWSTQGQQSPRWETSDVKYDAGKLTFTRKSTNPDRPMEMKYTLTAQNDTMSGTAVSQRGERSVEGKRLYSDIIGKWELTMTSDRGERTQLLYVKPDLTAYFGSVEVGKIDYRDGAVSFDYEFGFGDRTFQSSFSGKLENGQLKGEMTGSRGTQQVKGKKM